MTQSKKSGAPRAPAGQPANGAGGVADASDPCVVFTLDWPDLTIRHITASAEIDPPDALGQTPAQLWPDAGAALHAMIQRAAAARRPFSAILQTDPPLTMLCVPQTDRRGHVQRVLLVQWRNVATTIRKIDQVMAAVRRLAAQIADGLPLQTMLESVVAELMAALDTHAVQIVLAEDTAAGATRLELVAGAPTFGQPLATEVRPGTFISQVIASGTPMRLSRAEILALAPVDQPLYERLQTYLGVPLRRGAEVFGALTVQRFVGTPDFTERETTMLSMVADEVAVAILQTRLRDSFAEAERRAAAVRELLDGLPASILWVGADFRVRYQNALQADLAHYTVGERLPLDSDAPHPVWRRPDDGQPYPWNTLPIPRTLATGQPHQAVLIVTDDAGQEHALLFNVQPLLDAQGGTVGAISVNVDITAQYQAQQAARHTAAKLDLIIESIADGVTIYDTHGQTIRYNRAALRLLGWSGANDPNVIRRTVNASAAYVFQALDGQPISCSETLVMRALRGTEPLTESFRMVRPDGRELVCRASAAPLRDPETGELLGAVGVFNDITAMYDVNRMKDEFISVASHELRTPLTTLLLACNLLERIITRPQRFDEIPSYVQRIKQQTYHISRIVNDMLDLTRISGGRFEIELQPGDLARAIRDAIEERVQFVARTITVRGLGEPISARFEPERIWQLVTNLLTNALRYSPPTAPVLVRAWRETVAGQPVLHLALTDQGRGIAPEHLTHIFDRFYRVADDDLQAAAQQRDGLGLGLYIAQAIVAAHAGRIWAESVVGAGTTIHVQLPISREEGIA